MKIYSVFDPEFARYGQIVKGLEESVTEILPLLAKTYQPEEGTAYSPSNEELEELPAAMELSEHCFGGMEIQLGHCNGHNTKLNCLEYHRNSEFNLGSEDFILLLGRQEDIRDGMLDTSTVKAFRIPAGVLIEVWATTLHFAPCHADPQKGFHVLIVLPRFTNTERPQMKNVTWEDEIMTARNKWLLAHPDSRQAKNGAKVGLTGDNIDISDSL